MKPGYLSHYSDKLWIRQLRFDSEWEIKIFLYPTVSKLALGHPIPLLLASGSSFPRGKVAKPLTFRRFQGQEWWIYISAPSYIMAWCLNN
jgi:hypothetical protein